MQHKKLIPMILLVLVLLLTACGENTAEPHLLRGKVQRIDGENVELYTENGQVRTWPIHVETDTLEVGKTYDFIIFEDYLHSWKEVANQDKEFYGVDGTDVTTEGYRSIATVNLLNREGRVTLYTDAEVTEEGEVLWDDGQQFMLVAEVNGNTFPLFQEYVQIGQPTFYVLEEDGVLKIVNVVVQTAGVHIYEYRYNDDSTSFEVRDIYHTTGNGNVFNVFD